MPSEITQSWAKVSMAGAHILRGVERNLEKSVRTEYCTGIVLNFAQAFDPGSSWLIGLTSWLGDKL